MSLDRVQGHQERYEGPMGSARLGFDYHMALRNRPRGPGKPCPSAWLGVKQAHLIGDACLIVVTQPVI